MILLQILIFQHGKILTIRRNLISRNLHENRAVSLILGGISPLGIVRIPERSKPDK
jgi:hypothetical protein